MDNELERLRAEVLLLRTAREQAERVIAENSAGWATEADAKARIDAAERRLAAVEAAARNAQCSCSLDECASGHRVDCWMPELTAALAEKKEGKHGND